MYQNSKVILWGALFFLSLQPVLAGAGETRSTKSSNTSSSRAQNHVRIDPEQRLILEKQFLLSQKKKLESAKRKSPEVKHYIRIINLQLIKVNSELRRKRGLDLRRDYTQHLQKNIYQSVVDNF